MATDSHLPPGKLGFFAWGVRWLDIAILMAYPTMGALFAMERPELHAVLRFLAFSALNFMFLAQIFIFNDWSDAILNPDEPAARARHALKGQTLSGREVLFICFALSALSFAGFSLFSFRLLVVALLIEAFTVSYSHPRINLKGKPVISTLVHFLGAALYFLGGWSVFKPVDRTGVLLALFFGMVLAAGHFSNEIQDFNHDLSAGIRTNAVAFGQRVVFRAGLLLFVLSSVFFVYVAATGLGQRPGTSGAYLAAGVCLCAAWLIQAFRYRGWKGGDSIASFRAFYRAAYAGFCAWLAAVRIAEWILSFRASS